MTLAAMNYLAVAAIWGGRNELGVTLMEEIRSTGSRMNLFDVRPTKDLLDSFIRLPSEDIKALAHVAWGCYGWST